MRASSAQTARAPKKRRTHDKALYLKENRYEKPKAVFLQMIDLVAASQVVQSGSIVCDFGCAAGELSYALRKRFPAASHQGYDVVPELIEKARAAVPGVDFAVGDVLDRSLRPPASVDVAFMTGVHSIFDDFRPCFSNLLHWTRPGGRIYVCGLFNPSAVDVWISYRLADEADAEFRESGWNLFSKRSVGRYLDEAAGAGSYRFIPVELPFDLPPHPDDPLRTWTFRDSEGRRLFTNGLSILCPLGILEISLEGRR